MSQALHFLNLITDHTNSNKRGLRDMVKVEMLDRFNMDQLIGLVVVVTTKMKFQIKITSILMNKIRDYLIV